MPPRLAVYYVPEKDEALWQVGTRLLGRSMLSLKPLPQAQPAVAGLSAKRFGALTSEPRRYGLHATLKAPFELCPLFSVSDVLSAVAAIARDVPPFSAGPLRLTRIASFFALVPEKGAESLRNLAAICVEELDPFREPETEAELAARKAKDLSPNQELLLAQWGYPYVFEEFRFHITLTNSIQDAVERGFVLAGLERYCAPLLGADLRIGSICVCTQPERSAPFTLLQRFTLRG